MQLSPTCHILGKELLRALEITLKSTSRWAYLQTNTTNQSNKYRWCFQKLNHLLSPCNFAFKCHTKYHLIYFSMTGFAACLGNLPGASIYSLPTARWHRWGIPCSLQTLLHLAPSCLCNLICAGKVNFWSCSAAVPPAAAAEGSRKVPALPALHKGELVKPLIQEILHVLMLYIMLWPTFGFFSAYKMFCLIALLSKEQHTWENGLEDMWWLLHENFIEGKAGTVLEMRKWLVESSKIRPSRTNWSYLYDLN